MSIRAGIEPLLSSNIVVENAETGTLIGILSNSDPDPNKTFHYSLPCDWDGPFKIIGNRLIVADGSQLDYENSPIYSIDVEVTSSTGEVLIKTFTIQILDVLETDPPPPVNQAPTDIVLTGNTVAENSPDTSAIGYFTASDPDGDPLHYTLLDDAGGRFKLHDNMIIVADGSLLDYETSPTHEVKVRVTDIHGASYEETFTIFVKDVNEDPRIPENPPTDIILSSRIVAENSEAGTAVGYLYAIDPDLSDNFTFALLDDADGRFAIIGNKLVVADGASLDFETNPLHEIRIRVTDAQGLSYEEIFTILVKDVNEEPQTPENNAPTNIYLSGEIVAENSVTGTIVGFLGADDPDAGDTFTYALLDNADGRFAIVGNKLVVANGALLDFEAASGHDIKIRVTDAQGLSYDKTFKILVKDVEENPEQPPSNHAPTQLMLMGGAVTENAANGSVIGSFIASDPDANETFTYTLLDDAGGRFVIKDGKLVVADGSLIDYETSRVHEIKVRVTDSHGASLDRWFAIAVMDADDTENPPTNTPPVLIFDGGSVTENATAGTVVGRIETFDDDGDLVTVSLLDDAGGRFRIDGDMLVVAEGAELDFEAQSSHQITIKAMDVHGAWITKNLTIKVNDVDENPGPLPPTNSPPSMVMLDGVSVVENAGNGTAIGRLKAYDPDGDALTFSLLDNADGRFAIRDGMVVVADGSKLDYETATSHQILVRVTDDHGAHRDALFTIRVRDVDENVPPVPVPTPENHTPVDLALSGDGIAENAARGSVVGILAAFDPDAGERFAYALMNDAGGRFKLSGSQIVVADGTKLDFEKAQSHTVTVRVTDATGLSFTKDLTIAVKDIAEEVISGSTGNDVIAGGTGNDRLYGGRGNDKLYGGTGKDVISGGLGNDLLFGGGGKDSFLFNVRSGKTTADRIADFSVKDDTIQLAKSVFAKIGKKGVLSKDAFWKGAKAQEADDRIGYDAESGNVYYDADGSGAGRAVKIANIGKDLTKLSHFDFFIF